MTEITQEMVNDALDNAVENDSEIEDLTPEEVCEDLQMCDSDFEDVPTEVLLPFVKNWITNS
jgi:hypothetical protein